MASQEISRFDVISRTNGVLPEAQVRLRNAARFLRIIFKISLYEHVRIITDNFYGVLISPYRSVGTEAPELAVNDTVMIDG